MRLQRNTPLKAMLQPLVLPAVLAAALVVSGCGDSSNAGAAKGQSAATQAPPPAAVTFETSYDEGCKRAQQEQKPLLLLFTIEGCTYCKEMKSAVLADTRVVELSRHFVCAEINLDRDAELCKRFRVRGYPTVLLADPEGKDLLRLTGVKPASVLTTEMETALRSMAHYTAARQNAARR